MNCNLLLLASFLLAGAATAQLPARARSPELQRSPAGSVAVDEPHADGVFWARGDAWKARIDAAGVTYYPRFAGAKAHTPIRFGLRGATAVKPQRRGTTLAFARANGVEERWEPRVQGLEQLFILSAPPATPDLTLRVDVETALRYRGYERGLVFAADGLGEVTYGEGVVFDAAGRRATVVPELEQGAITLHVPASFLDGASYPVTVDPLVSSFTVVSTARSQFHPDVARDGSFSDEFVVVYEEQFNAADHDVYGNRYAPDGTFVEQFALDITTDLCQTPKICSTRSGTVLIAIWDNEGNVVSSVKGIQARAIRLSTSTMEPVAQVTTDGALEDCRDPDIGGGTQFGTNNIGQMAVFVRRTAGVNFSLRGIRLQANGLPGTANEFVIDNSPGCDPKPDISPNGGAPLHWVVVWQKKNTFCNGGDIWWAPVTLGGLIQAANILEAGPEDELLPHAFTDRTDTLITWQQATTTFGSDTDAVLLRRNVGNGTFAQIGPKVALSAFEPGVTRAADQSQVAVGFDGCRHSYVYMENQHPRAACVFVGEGAYDYSEGHVNLSATTNNCGAPAITYVPTDDSSVRYVVVWQEDVGSHFDVRGAFYDGRAAAGGVSVVPTGCGRVQTGIRSVGVPAIGHDFEVQLTNVAGIPLIVMGLPTPPIALCTAITPCQLGVFPIVATVPGAQFATQLPCDASLVGGRFAFQGLDVNAGFGCTAAQLGVPLRPTDTLVVQFQ